MRSSLDAKEEDYHVHCNYNDHSSPDLTIPNVIRQAKSMQLRVLAITEHVRKSSDWIPRYLEEIKENTRTSSSADFKIIPGFEAKILPDGTIDCPEEYADKYFLIASFHTQYKDKQLWLYALERAVKNTNVNVIGHIAPESSFTLDSGEIEHIARLISEHKKTVELNAKYQRPPKEWVTIFRMHGVRFHLGSDAHSLGEIGRYEKISDLIELAWGNSILR